LLIAKKPAEARPCVETLRVGAEFEALLVVKKPAEPNPVVKLLMA